MLLSPNLHLGVVQRSSHVTLERVRKHLKQHSGFSSGGRIQSGARSGNWPSTLALRCVALRVAVAAAAACWMRVAVAFRCRLVSVVLCCFVVCVFWWCSWVVSVMGAAWVFVVFLMA